MTRLSHMGWPEAAERSGRGAILLLPVGATEQHGPHLPLTTDTDLAVAVAERAAELDARAVVTPALAFGSSGEHADFAGTLSIGTLATEQVLVELARSASLHFTGLVMVCTHGGNLEALQRAVRVLRSEGRATEVWVPRWGGDLHAGRTETSLMLAVAPERVNMTAAAAGDRRPAADLMPLLRQHGVRAVSDNGVLGDPTGANAEEGERLLDGAARDLSAVVARCGVRTPAGAELR
jgi:mycofactocin system creatininase family protein